MEHLPETIKVRDAEAINTIVVEVIQETTEIFKSELSNDDQEKLQWVVMERSTTPLGRIIFLRRLAKEKATSPHLMGVVNNILISLRQKLNQNEIKFYLTGAIQKGLLDEIP